MSIILTTTAAISLLTLPAASEPISAGPIPEALAPCSDAAEESNVDFNVMDSGHSVQIEEVINGLTETMGLDVTECVTRGLGIPEWLFAQMGMTPLSGLIEFPEVTVSWSSDGENSTRAYILIYDSTVGGGA